MLKPLCPLRPKSLFSYKFESEESIGPVEFDEMYKAARTSSATGFVKVYAHSVSDYAVRDRKSVV